MQLLEGFEKEGFDSQHTNTSAVCYAEGFGEGELIRTNVVFRKLAVSKNTAKHLL